MSKKQNNIEAEVTSVEKIGKIVIVIAKRTDSASVPQDISFMDVSSVMKNAMQIGMQAQEQMMPAVKLLKPDMIKIPMTLSEYEDAGKPSVGENIYVHVKAEQG